MGDVGRPEPEIVAEGNPGLCRNWSSTRPTLVQLFRSRRCFLPHSIMHLLAFCSVLGSLALVAASADSTTPLATPTTPPAVPLEIQHLLQPRQATSASSGSSSSAVSIPADAAYVSPFPRLVAGALQKDERGPRRRQTPVERVERERGGAQL